MIEVYVVSFTIMISSAGSFTCLLAKTSGQETSLNY